MSDTTSEVDSRPAVSPAVAAIRAHLREGLALVKDFAEAAEKNERTIYNWIAMGMPTQHIGRTQYVVIEPARQ
jgi:hypothetical protein